MEVRPLSKNQIAMCIIYKNCHHSLEGSDYTNNKHIQKAIKLCRLKFEEITGEDMFDFSAHMDTFIEQLENIGE